MKPCASADVASDLLRPSLEASSLRQTVPHFFTRSPRVSPFSAVRFFSVSNTLSSRKASPSTALRPTFVFKALAGLDEAVWLVFDLFSLGMANLSARFVEAPGLWRGFRKSAQALFQRSIHTEERRIDSRQTRAWDFVEADSSHDFRAGGTRSLTPSSSRAASGFECQHLNSLYAS